MSGDIEEVLHEGAIPADQHLPIRVRRRLRAGSRCGVARSRASQLRSARSVAAPAEEVSPQGDLAVLTDLGRARRSQSRIVADGLFKRGDGRGVVGRELPRGSDSRARRSRPRRPVTITTVGGGLRTRLREQREDRRRTPASTVPPWGRVPSTRANPVLIPRTVILGMAPATSRGSESAIMNVAGEHQIRHRTSHHRTRRAIPEATGPAVLHLAVAVEDPTGVDLVAQQRQGSAGSRDMDAATDDEDTRGAECQAAEDRGRQEEHASQGEDHGDAAEEHRPVRDRARGAIGVERVAATVRAPHGSERR